jgi:proteasome lid subunit RPN8/RPN11
MTQFVMIALPREAEAQLRRHCEAQYPHEACGALLGRGDGRTSAWQVAEVRPAPNEHGGDRQRHYLVPPDPQLQAERHAAAAGLDVLGYYHSHPDHPACPSAYDRTDAWFGYLYLICSVDRGHAVHWRALALAEPAGPFLGVGVDGQDRPAA